jgi:hypothetical protein
LPGGKFASKVAGFFTEVVTVTLASLSMLPVFGRPLKEIPLVRSLWQSAFQQSDAYDNAQGREIGSGARLDESIWELVYDRICTNKPGEGPDYARKYSALYYEAFLQQDNKGRGRGAFFGFFSDYKPGTWGPEK